MSTNNQTKTALRAALHQEDAALQERLPAAAAAAPARPKRAGKAQKPAPAAARVARAKSVRAKATAVKAAVAADPATPAPVEIADQPEAAPGQETVATPMQAAPASPKKKGAAKAATTENAKKEKPEMVVRDSFSMPPREHRRLKALREELGKTGRLASKSEVLRAGLALLSQRDTTEIVTLLDALPRVVKGKRSKKQR